jgi:transposase
MQGDDATAEEAPGLDQSKPETVAQCHEVIAQLVAHNSRLQQQIAALEERLKLDSRNSSKPPSSDGPGRGKRAKRRVSGRRRGGQKGHPGAFRALLPEGEVDRIVECPTAAVCECGGAVQVDAEAVRHQVSDVPTVRAQVEEYRLHAGRCTACGRPHRARLPVGVPSGQIGPRALALIGMLDTRYQLTQGKTRDLLAQVLGLDFSLGAISQAHGKVAQALYVPVHEATRLLAASPVVHMDETRYPREGTSGNWAWAMVAPAGAVFSVLPSRARYVIDDLLGHTPQGVVVSDRYAAYGHIDASRRQLCWAHLLRDFTRIADRAGEPGRLGGWLLACGGVLFRWREANKPAAAFEPLQRRLQHTLERGAQQTACRRTAATCANLLRSWPSLWTFLHHPQVPPTNNDAERALRPLVLKRKISGPTRSRRGDDFLARGFSVIETCRRQGRDALEYFHQAVIAWIDKVAAPPLLRQVDPVPTG